MGRDGNAYLQWIFTGGRRRWLAISEFLMVRASSSFLPLTHSEATELLRDGGEQCIPGGDGGAAAERLELGVDDGAVLDFDLRMEAEGRTYLELHDVSTDGGAGDAGADVDVVLVQTAYAVRAARSAYLRSWGARSGR